MGAGLDRFQELPDGIDFIAMRLGRRMAGSARRGDLAQSPLDGGKGLNAGVGTRGELQPVGRKALRPLVHNHRRGGERWIGRNPVE